MNLPLSSPAWRGFLCSVAIAWAGASPVVGAEGGAPVAVGAVSAESAEAVNQWVEVSRGWLDALAAQGVVPFIKFKSDEAPGAGISGVFADRTRGTTFVVVHGQGIFRYSEDGKKAGGAAFERVDGGQYDAFYEHAGPDIDPEGRGLAVFSIQGKTVETTSAISRDAGRTWSSITTDGKSYGFDLGVVDWAGGGQTLLAIRHHNRDLALSRDGGNSWQILAPKETKVRSLGLLGGDVLIKGVSGPEAGLHRSADAGVTWQKVADCTFTNLSPVVVFQGRAYVATTGGVLVSADSGQHWTPLGTGAGELRGPVMFGRDARHLVVFSVRGFYESTDAGETWMLAVPLGDDPELRRGRYEYGSWNPADDCFYVTHIGGQAFRYRRQ